MVVCLFACLSVCVYVCVFVCLLACLLDCLFACLSVCMFVASLVCLSVCFLVWFVCVCRQNLTILPIIIIIIITADVLAQVHHTRRRHPLAVGACMVKTLTRDLITGGRGGVREDLDSGIYHWQLRRRL